MSARPVKEESGQRRGYRRDRGPNHRAYSQEIEARERRADNDRPKREIGYARRDVRDRYRRQANARRAFAARGDDEDDRQDENDPALRRPFRSNEQTDKGQKGKDGAGQVLVSKHAAPVARELGFSKVGQPDGSNIRA